MLIFSGTVIHGQKLGRQLGFPTANLDPNNFMKLGMNPKWGIYAGLVLLPNQKIWPAGIVIGPLGIDGKPKLEAHLIGFSGNLYQQTIGILTLEFLRPYQSFSSVTLLKRQISKDLTQTKKIIKPYLANYVTTY